MEVNPAGRAAVRINPKPEGQWCSRFQRLNGNVASDLTDDRQVQELADQEELVVLQMCMSLRWHRAPIIDGFCHVGDGS